LDFKSIFFAGAFYSNDTNVSRTTVVMKAYVAISYKKIYMVFKTKNLVALGCSG